MNDDIDVNAMVGEIFDAAGIEDGRQYEARPRVPTPLPEPLVALLDPAAEPWPALDPLPEPADDTDPDPFPFDALGPILGAAARAIAEGVQAPDSLAAGAVLAAFATSAQALADIRMPHGATCPLSPFVATAVASGERKSAVDLVACEPINEVRRRDAREAARQSLQRDADEKPPAPRSLIVGRATIEGVQMLLRGQSHVGLFSTEGAEVFGGHSMREDRRMAGIASMLKGWGGEPQDSLTRGDGLSVLLGRRMSMHVLMQPVVFRTIASDPLAQGQGLLARMLVACPRGLAGTRLFREGDPVTEHPHVLRYYGVLRHTLEMPPALRGEGDPYELDPPPLQMTREARALWIAAYNQIERWQADDGPLAGARAWASKAAEHAARIAGVVALSVNPEVRHVDDEAMDCGIQAMNFYLSEHVRLLSTSQCDTHLERLRLLAGWMQERGRFVPAGHVLRCSPRSLRDLKAQGLNPLLTELSERGYIRRIGDRWEVRDA